MAFAASIRVVPGVSGVLSLAVADRGGLAFTSCLGESFGPGSPCREAPGVGSAAAIAVSGDGRNLYVAGYGPTLIALERNPVTGELRPLPLAPAAASRQTPPTAVSQFAE